MEEIYSTPTIQTLTTYMNDGLHPEIQACILLPCVMATMDYTCEPEDTPPHKEYEIPEPHKEFQRWKDNMDAIFPPGPPTPLPPNMTTKTI